MSAPNPPSVDNNRLIHSLFENLYKERMRQQGAQQEQAFILLFGSRAVEITPLFSPLHQAVHQALSQGDEADPGKTQLLLRQVIGHWVAQIVAQVKPDMVVQFSTGLTPIDAEAFRQRVEKGELRSPLELPPEARRQLAICLVENRFPELNMTLIDEVKLDEHGDVTGFDPLDERYGEPNHQGPYADLFNPQSDKRPGTLFDVSAEAQKNAAQIETALAQAPAESDQGIIYIELAVES